MDNQPLPENDPQYFREWKELVTDILRIPVPVRPKDIKGSSKPTSAFVYCTKYAITFGVWRRWNNRDYPNVGDGLGAWSQTTRTYKMTPHRAQLLLVLVPDKLNIRSTHILEQAIAGNVTD